MKQWSKNLIIFLAFFFTVNETWSPTWIGETLSLLPRVFLAFAIFCVLASAIYLINDVFDIKRDRLHPRKQLRAIASGQLPIGVALAGSGIFIVLGLSAAFLIGPVFVGISAAYVVLMIIYTVAIKRIILLDVFAISAGFVLRAVAGAVVLSAPISPWLYICTGLGSLFLSLSKRRSELSNAGENAETLRDTLKYYSLPLLDQLISVMATSTMLAYALYTFTAVNLPQNHTMMLTIPFVIYGLFRYIYLLNRKNIGENPEETLITDIPLVTVILLWLITSATILGLFRT